MSQVIEVIEAAVQNYDWGKKGSSSLVAQLQDSGSISEEKPYAELWLGTHPNGPSYVVKEGEKNKLSDYLTKQNKSIPYLLKIESVNAALSIQSHPNIHLAKILHKTQPENYKDANRKPEMLVALTDFEGLVGFRPLDQIANFFKTVPELKSLISETNYENIQYIVSNYESIEKDSLIGKKSLQQIFTEIMNVNDEKRKTAIDSLIQRLSKIESPNALDSLIIRLNKEHPYDIGVFSPYLLNYTILKPGQAIFIHANEPHAYLYGDGVECMACSDNVVRAGLTKKFIDVKVLCEMLTYHYGEADIYNPDSRSYVYHPPDSIREFQVTKIVLGENESFTLEPCKDYSIVLVINGDGTIQSSESKVPFKRGSKLLIPETELKINSTSKDTMIFIASSNQTPYIPETQEKNIIELITDAHNLLLSKNYKECNDLCTKQIFPIIKNLYDDPSNIWYGYIWSLLGSSYFGLANDKSNDNDNARRSFYVESSLICYEKSKQILNNIEIENLKKSSGKEPVGVLIFAETLYGLNSLKQTQFESDSEKDSVSKIHAHLNGRETSSNQQELLDVLSNKGNTIQRSKLLFKH